jgi:hypothetical protein
MDTLKINKIIILYYKSNFYFLVILFMEYKNNNLLLDTRKLLESELDNINKITYTMGIC